MEDFDIQEELKKLPAKPGVYIMHDRRDNIIYVGKAVILKNRVRSYFRASTKKSPKIQEMVKRIDYFEYIVTDSELEALVLECNLIKEHRPKYNTMLKDDKTYPFIKVTVTEDFPRLVFTRQMKRDKNRYFGPYTSAGAVKDTIDLISRIYGLRTCQGAVDEAGGKNGLRSDSSGPEGGRRACLNYHIGRCSGPCEGHITKEEYAQGVEGALKFLGGNYDSVIKYVTEKMQSAASRMEYEEAGRYKELLASVNAVAQKQKITDSDGEDKDVVAMYGEDSDAVVSVFFVRDGRMIGREHFYISNADTPDIVLQSFIKQFYAGAAFIPKEIIAQYDFEERELVEEWLTSKRGRGVTVRVPKKGMKERFVELAAKNAQMVLTQDREKIKRREGRTIGAAKEIADLLGLEGVSRMEAYDISNIGGFESVGSMVVFEKGRPKKSDYRRFRIKTVTGSNDYASMEEVLGRRFTHGLEELKNEEDTDILEYGSFTRFPDLIMMDGGRGQVNSCLKVLRELGLSIPVCGMVKDDHHRTRGLYFNDVELPIDRHSEGFKLITRIQDEAHRFAIEYHRSLRSKDQVRSVLDEIRGIGPARRKALLRTFGSAEGVAAATCEELAKAPSMDAASAAAVHSFFHPTPNVILNEVKNLNGGEGYAVN